jgi:hypothetical protein
MGLSNSGILSHTYGTLEFPIAFECEEIAAMIDSTTCLLRSVFGVLERRVSVM